MPKERAAYRTPRHRPRWSTAPGWSAGELLGPRMDAALQEFHLKRLPAYFTKPGSHVDGPVLSGLIYARNLVHHPLTMMMELTDAYLRFVPRIKRDQHRGTSASSGPAWRQDAIGSCERRIEGTSAAHPDDWWCERCGWICAGMQSNLPLVGNRASSDLT